MKSPSFRALLWQFSSQIGGVGSGVSPAGERRRLSSMISEPARPRDTVLFTSLAASRCTSPGYTHGYGPDPGPGQPARRLDPTSASLAFHVPPGPVVHPK